MRVCQRYCIKQLFDKSVNYRRSKGMYSTHSHCFAKAEKCFKGQQCQYVSSPPSPPPPHHQWHPGSGSASLAVTEVSKQLWRFNGWKTIACVFSSARRHKHLLARVLAEVVSEELRALRDNRSCLSSSNSKLIKRMNPSVNLCFAVLPARISIGVCCLCALLA